MRRLTLYFICLLLFVSCKEKAKTEFAEMKSFLGSTVLLTDSITSKVEDFYPDKKYFLLIYLNKEECAPCILEKMSLLKNYKMDFDKFYTGILLVIQKQEENKMDDISFILNKLRVDYPVVFDENDVFVNKNKMVLNKHCNTFILDRKNKVIWIGSPIQNEQSLNRYRDMMNLLI